MSILSNHQTEALDALNGRTYGSDFHQDGRPEAWDSMPTDAEIDRMAEEAEAERQPLQLRGLADVLNRLRSVEHDNRTWGNVERADCYSLAAGLLEEELAQLRKAV